MIKFLVTSESRCISLEFTAEKDLAKTHLVAVKATYLPGNFTWQFTYKSSQLVTAESVVHFAKKVVSSRSKTFWTAAAKSLQKEAAERKKNVETTADFFRWQATELKDTKEQSWGEYYKQTANDRIYSIQLGYETVMKIIDILISCL